MVDGEYPGPGTYEYFHEVCHWGRREETCSSDSFRGLRGAQKAMGVIYVELLGKIRIVCLFLIFESNTVIIENISSTEKHKKK